MHEELEAGREIAGYRIEGIAGRGGMGVVYRATQLGLDRLVALKVIAPDLARDPDFRARFETESRLAAQVRNPHVITVYDAREADGLLFIAMEYIEGTDLRAAIAREGRTEPRRAVRIVGETADALDAAHRRGLVHRDVKPANILLRSETRGERAYLTDFGAAKETGTATTSGHMLGTLDYMAPEQVRGERVDARADVYALGCVLFHALTGQVPFPRSGDAAKLYAQAHDTPPAPSTVAGDLPLALDDVLHRALAKDPAHRYPSAGDLGRAARAAVEGAPAPEPRGSVAKGRAAPEDAATIVVPPPAGPEAPTRVAGVAGARRRDAADRTRVAPASRAAPPRSAGGGARDPRRRWVLVAGTGAAFAVAGVAVALLLAGGDDPSDRAATGAGGRTTTARQRSTTTTPAPGPAMPPGRYAGTTSQGRPISFEVAGTTVQDIAFTEVVSCVNPTSGATSSVEFPFRGLRSTRATVEPGGRFRIDVRRPEQTFTMNGAYDGDVVSGAFRHVYDADDTGNLAAGAPRQRCDSDDVSYRAQR